MAKQNTFDFRVAKRRAKGCIGQRNGSAAVETLLVLAVVIVASFIFFYLGRDVIGQYFGEGNHYLSVPIY